MTQLAPASRERRNVLVGILDHQVAVEGDVDRFAQRRDHRRPDRNIGHKMPIHNIDMEEGRSTSHRLIGILGQTGEISRQYGRRYLDQDKTSLASI